MVDFFQVYLLDNFDGLDFLQFGFKIALHFFFHPFFEGYVEVGLVGDHAFDEFSFFALEKAEDGHSFFIVMQAISERACFEIGEKAEEVFVALIEFDSYFFFELVPFVFDSFLHISRLQ